MSRRISTQSPQWKSVEAARSGRPPTPFSILPKVEKLVQDIAKDVGVYQFKSKSEAAAKVIEQQLSRMGYEVASGLSRTKTPYEAILWELIEGPLLGAMERGIEEFLNDYISDSFKRMRFTLVDDLYLQLGERLVAATQKFLDASDVQGITTKARLQVVSETIQIYVDDFPLAGPDVDYDDPFWTKLESELTDIVRDFERRMDMKADIQGPEIVSQYGDALVFSVYFENS